MVSELSLTLHESSDTDDGIVRLDQADMRLLGLLSGDVMALMGSRVSYARVLPAFMEDRNQRVARVSPLLARNLGATSQQKIKVQGERLKPPVAEQVTIQLEDDIDRLYVLAWYKQLIAALQGRPVIAGDILRFPSFERNPVQARVLSLQPVGPGVISSGTSFSLSVATEGENLPDLGGLRGTYRACESMAVARLRKKKASTPRAVLLSGPAGCGKARLVTRLARQLDVALEVLDAQNLLDRCLVLGAGEIDVSLTALARRGPTLLLLDHLEALMVRETQAPALMMAAQAVLAQICGLLDEMSMQPDLMLFATSAGPVSSRFHQQQRFDIVMPVDPPNRYERHEVLLLATRNLPLTEEVDLARLANLTGGMTGRDLARFVTTAAQGAEEARISETDFLLALRFQVPSATGGVRCDIPEESWDDVAELGEVKRLLHETLSWSLQGQRNLKIFGAKAPQALVLSGGKGTGKTSTARSLASGLSMNFIEIACPLLTAQSRDEAVRHVRACFAVACRRAPCLLFLDDIDVLFESVSAPDDVVRLHPVVAQILVEIDKLQAMSGVVVLAATSRADRLSFEFVRSGRFDFTVTLPLPDALARKKILQIHARKLPLAADIDFDHLAGLTQGMTPAEIAALCNRVGLMALQQAQGEGSSGVIPPVVNAELFEQLLRGRKN